MISNFRRYLFLGFAALALAACETSVPVQTLPEITFTHMPVLGLNVAKVTVESTFTPSVDPPHVEELLPVSPEKALRRWAADRLAAKGSGNEARFTIVDAAVTRTPLKVDKGLKGMFTDEQAARYTATAAATLEVLDDRGFRLAFASARVTRSNTLGEKASLNDRDRMTFKLVEDLMHDFNAEMERNLHAYVGAYMM